MASPRKDLAVRYDLKNIFVRKIRASANIFCISMNSDSEISSRIISIREQLFNHSTLSRFIRQISFIRVMSMYAIMREMKLAHAFSVNLFELIIKLLYKFIALNIYCSYNSHNLYNEIYS